MKISDRRSTGRDIDKEDKDAPDQPYARAGNRPGRSRTLNRLIPLLMLIIIATVILKDQVPAVSDKIDALINPEGFAAVQVCREAALRQSPTPDFARLVQSGKAKSTRRGFFIDRLVIGEMDDQGGERRVAIGCHVDQNGKLVKLSRSPDAATTIITPGEPENPHELTTEAD